MEEIYRFVATVRFGVINEGGLTSVGILYHSKQSCGIKAKFVTCNMKDFHEKNARDL